MFDLNFSQSLDWFGLVGVMVSQTVRSVFLFIVKFDGEVSR